MSKRRVTLLVQNLPVPFDRRVWMEATTLRDGGYAVTVVCPSDDRHPAGTFKIDGIVVTRYRAVPEGAGLFGYLREYVWALLAMSVAMLRTTVRTGRPNVIHFCNPPDFLFLVALPYKLVLRSRLIFDQHDLGPELVRAKQMSPVFVRFAGLLERLTYRASDAVISTNESYRAVAETRGKVPPERIQVVRSAPRRDAIAPVRSDNRWREGRKYLLGYVGVMGIQEGIQYLLEAVRLLVQEGWDVHLALVGSGPARPELEKLAGSLGVTDRVTFHGRVSDEDLCAILSSADVCVNPDEVNELNDKSTMNKIVEYMALAKPIVQFDVTEGRFSAGEASLYARANDSVDFAFCVASLLEDTEARERMGTFARARFLEDLSWETQAEKLLDHYDRVLGRA